MSVKQRLLQFIKSKNLSVRAFEKSIPLSNGYVNNIKNSISEAKLKSIALQYPDLNLVWLVFGHGNLLLSNAINEYEAINLSSVQKEPDQPNFHEEDTIGKTILLLAETANKLTDENERIRKENAELRRIIDRLESKSS